MNDKVKLHDDSHITQEDDFLLLDEDSDMDDILMNVITAGQDERDDLVQLPHVETEHSVVLQTCDVSGVEEALNKAIYNNVLAIPQSLLNVQINNLISNDYTEKLTKSCHEITGKFNSLFASKIPEKMSYIVILPLSTGHSLCTLAHQITKILSVNCLAWTQRK